MLMVNTFSAMNRHILEPVYNFKCDLEYCLILLNSKFMFIYLRSDKTGIKQPGNRHVY